MKARIIKDVTEKSEFQNTFQQNSFFTMKKLEEFVALVGFKIIDNGYITFKPFTHNQMQLLIDKKYYL